MLQVELDYKLLLTELLRKQIGILGSDITLGSVRKIAGIVISETGEILEFSKDPHLVVQSFIDTFIALYGVLAERTIEPILIHYGYSWEQSSQTLYNPNAQKQPPSGQIQQQASSQRDTAMGELNKLITEINKNPLSK